MTRRGSAATCWRGEGGYTLIELLIVTAVLGIIAGALFNVFDVSQRLYTRSSSLEDAQTGARSGVDQLATELRLAGSYWADATGAGPAITAASATSITFIGDINADSASNGVDPRTTTAVASGATSVTLDVPAAQVAGGFKTGNPALNDFVYVGNGFRREVRRLSAVAGSTLTLATPLTTPTAFPVGSIVRSTETVTYAFDAPGSRITRTVGPGAAETLVENVTGFQLLYFDGSTPPVATAVLANIREIEIRVTTRGADGSVRTMRSRVKPRNLI